MDAQAAEFVEGPELLARCRAGESVAWRQLYDAHFDFVWRVARRLGTPEAELDDVCQETFLIAFRRLDSFREGRFTTWLYRIAANVASERHRRRRVARTFSWLFGQPASEPVVERGPDAQVESREAEEIALRVLERMGRKKREVFVLFEIEGLSGEEVAERVGCRLETVWTRLHYARKDFARLVKQLG